MNAFGAYRAIVVAQPFAGGAYLIAIAILAGLAMLALARGRAAWCFWCAVGIVLTNLIFDFGDDLPHHIYRIVVLAEQIRHGGLDLLVTDARNGEVLPTFVYYSVVPYLPAVLLNLVGLPAHAALKIVSAGEFLLLAAGLQRLVDLQNPRGEARSAAMLAAILFLTATQVHQTWLNRMAFAETGVYCLIPWIVVLLLHRGSAAMLTLVFFLQATAHPIVFGQALAGALVVVCGLSKEPLVVLARRCLLPLAAATVAASPFWLPPFLWKDLALGPAALPVQFSDTFFALGDLFEPRNIRTLGIVLPAALLLMIGVRHFRLPLQAWFLSVAMVACVALQTRYLRPVTLHLPLLSYSLFVWRLMMPTAFIGFGALLAGWPRQHTTAQRALAVLAALSILLMMAISLAGTSANFPRFSLPISDHGWVQAYFDDASPWGQVEFEPNYSGVPRSDIPRDDAQQVSFEGLRAGVQATARYVFVPKAPVKIVDYTVNGAAVPLGAIDGGLVLGPLAPGDVVQVATGKLTTLLYLRLAVLLVTIAGLLAVWARFTLQARRSRGILRRT